MSIVIYLYMLVQALVIVFAIIILSEENLRIKTAALLTFIESYLYRNHKKIRNAKNMFK